MTHSEGLAPRLGRALLLIPLRKMRRLCANSLFAICWASSTTTNVAKFGHFCGTILSCKQSSHLRECLSANQDDEDEPLPPGRLAERTANRVSSSNDEELERMAAGKQSFRAGGDPPSGVLGWSLADLTVAGGVMLAVSMLVFPALRDSRDGTRLVACQNNQRGIWFLDAVYADNHHKFFPIVRPNENVGMWVARLVEAVPTPRSWKPIWYVPHRPWRRIYAMGRRVILVPTRNQLVTMPRDELAKETAPLSMCYGYRLAQKVGDGYVYPHSGPSKEKELVFEPLFGDISDDPNAPMKSNHRGGVIQLMGQNGNSRSFSTTSSPAWGGDGDLYHNYLGFVDVGIGADDIVLAPSNAWAFLDLEGQEK